jgi:CubicO group peptidase (beta-lactamase class C family)
MQNINQTVNPAMMSYHSRSICLNFSLLSAILLLWLVGISQMDFNEADQLLKQNQKALGNNLVALVWRDGKVVFQKQLEKQIGDFSPKEQVPIYGSSQWMTAALVMTFVDEGKLSLDDKVSKFIPLFATYMKTYITIRNCLTNTTGIQADAVGAMKLLQKGKFETLEDEVNSFASKREIQTNPGTEFYYSHTGPNIAGRVLEIISKKGFDRLMQERIIRPLKMRGTTFSNMDGGAINPSGGAESTANDYMNFLTMLLNKGVFLGKRVLSEKAVAEMEKAQFPQLPVKYVPKGTEGFQFGLGVWLADNDTKGSPTILCEPSLSGSWPYLDLCRNYAAILLLKSPESESKKDLYIKFKEAVEKQFSSTCQ